MLLHAILGSFAAAATLVLSAAVPELSPADTFNPTATRLGTPVYDFIEQPLNNAERLRRGLPPLPPRFRHKRYNQGIGAPGPVSPEPDAPEPSTAPPQPSGGGGGMDPEPVTTHEGIVQVSDEASGKVLGYLSNKLTAFGQLGVEKHYKNPIEVLFKTKRASAQPGSIQITNGDNRPGRFLGAVVSEWTPGAVLGRGKGKFTYITRTGETKPGVGPMNVIHAIMSMFGMKNKAESAIWTLADQFTGDLHATWTNPGGETLNTTVFYYKKYNALALSADPTAFAHAHTDAVPVKLAITAKPVT